MHRSRKHRPLDNILSHMNSVNNSTPYFCNIYFNIILPDRSPLQRLSWELPAKIFINFLFPHACYLFRPRYSLWFYSNYNNTAIWKVQIMKPLSVYFSRSPITSFLSGSNILLSTLLSKLLNLRPSLRAKNRVSHQFKIVCAK